MAKRDSLKSCWLSAYAGSNPVRRIYGGVQLINATVCLPIRNEQEISLGLKLQKVGAGKYNGYGGKKTDADQTIEDTARRELKEEAGIEAEDLEKVAEITFYWPQKPEWNQLVHVYVTRRWKGEIYAAEPDKITPEWHPLTAVPYNRMMPADQHWLPKVLKGEYVKATFTYNPDNTLESFVFG